MLFTKPANLLYLKNQAVEIYSPEGSLSSKLNFPSGVIKSEEIINPQKLTELIVQFAKTNNIVKQNFIILLAEEVYFAKSILNDQNSQKSQIQKFLDEVPIDPAETASKYLIGETNLILATNKRYFDVITSAFSQVNSKIDAVVPSIVFGIKNDPSLNFDQVKNVLQSKNLIKISNFLTVSKTKEVNQSASKSQDRIKPNIILVILFIIAAMGILAFVIYRQFGSIL